MSILTCFGAWRPVACILAGTALLFACTIEAPAKKRANINVAPDPKEPPPPEEPIEVDLVNETSGAFGASERPSSSGFVSFKDGGAGDGGSGPTRAYCGETVVAGDLAIVELMIASKSGSNDSAEWVEVQNTRDCWLKMKGVSVESPRGAAGANVATFEGDFDLAPQATFVVAGAAEPSKNNNLTGKVLGFSATDVLKNDGDTIVVKLGSTEVDKVTYPAFRSLPVGRALSFPANCTWSDRSDWARWSLTYQEFSPGFKGTPNAPNNDVSCF